MVSRLDKVKELGGRKGYSLRMIADESNASFDYVYCHVGIKRRTNPDTGRKFSGRAEYEDYLCRRRLCEDEDRFFTSRADYQQFMAKKRATEPVYIAFSTFLKEGLKRLDKNAAWLARQADLTREMVSRYVNAKAIPKDEKLNRILLALGIDHLPTALARLIENH